VKIIVAGTGFVGLTHAAVLAEEGHQVYAYDVDREKLAAYRSGEAARIERYVNEVGLAPLIAEQLGRYLFFLEPDGLPDVIDGAEAVFLCPPTPPNLDGSTDLRPYMAMAEELAGLLARRQDTRRVVLVNKSTVPIGTARRLQGVLERHGVPNVGVASNPEFLPEGNAVDKSRRPDRVVVGADTEEDFAILRRVYPQFHNHVRIAYLETTPETAEAIKYVANTLLLTYISFWNGVGARLAECFGNVDMDDLKRGVTADERISTWGSYVSNGAGGSCFGKDIRSLIWQFGRQSQQARLLEEVYRINEFQKSYLIERVVHEAGFDFNNKAVALLGLSFKKHTNDMRDASSLKVVEGLLAKGVREIRAYDPVAMAEARRWFDPARNVLFEKLTYWPSAEAALSGSDAAVITTDWEEFRGLAGVIPRVVPPPYLVIDGRRMIGDYPGLVRQGYRYLAVGSPMLEPVRETA
jgi:UDPglucose 6-dehydrogenase